MANIVVRREGSDGPNDGWPMGFILWDGQTVEFQQDGVEHPEVHCDLLAKKALVEENIKPPIFRCKTEKTQGKELGEHLFRIELSNPPARTAEDQPDGSTTTLIIRGSGG